MEKFNPLFWLLGVLLMYASICVFVVLSLEAWRYKNTKIIAANIIALVPAILFSQLMKVDLPLRFLGTFLLAFVLLLIALKYTSMNETNPERGKQRDAYFKNPILHIALVAGFLGLLAYILRNVPVEKLDPIYWLFGVLLMYASICVFVVLTFEGIKYKSGKLLIFNVGSLLPAILFLQYVQTRPSIRFMGFFGLVLIFIALHLVYVWLTEKDWKRLKQRKEFFRHTILHETLLTGSIIFLVPFIWLITTSLKEESETFKYPPVWIPTQQVKMDINGKQCGLASLKINGKMTEVAEIAENEDGSKTVRELKDGALVGKEINTPNDALIQKRHFAPKWDNYTAALNFLPEETHKGLLYLWNTIYITLLSILGTLLSSSLVAYSFARLRWPGRDTLFGLLLATMMLPSAVTMIPVFLIFRTLGWYDTLKPLWIGSFFAGAFSVFLLRQFFMTIPTELEDAAKIDGCSYFGIYWRIMLPLIKPALAALTIMTFMGTWNDFMRPLIYLNSPEKMTLAYGLQLFQSSSHGSEYGLLMAASTLVMIPVLLIFFFTQRYFIQGITLTGMGGK